MPVSGPKEARDEMLTRMKAAIDASSYSTIVVKYADAQRSQPRGDSDDGGDPATPTAPGGHPWLHAMIQHSTGGAATLGGVGGKRRHEQTGTIIVEVRTPVGDGLDRSDDLVKIVLDAYRTGGATPGGIQFRNAAPNEVGASGAWHITECRIDFEYDEIV